MVLSSRQFGLIGYPLSHSFSPGFFARKFERLGLDHCSYELFPLPSLESLPDLIGQHPALAGLNVTIPHKTAVIPYLHELDPEAKQIGAVNCIAISHGRWKGYNTDAYGFEKSLLAFLPNPMPPLHALVLGTGGAAKAVWFVLEKLGIPYNKVSRQPCAGELGYDSVTAQTLQAHRLVVNTTPLGMAPHLSEAPTLPYDAAGPGHFFYDLVYNPEKTTFLRNAETAGAATQNGLSMLHLQAERAWEIWAAG